MPVRREWVAGEDCDDGGEATLVHGRMLVEWENEIVSVHLMSVCRLA